MKLILNWSKQQWLGMDAYQKVRAILAVRSILAALPISIICKSLTLYCYFLNNPQFVLAHHR